MSQTIENRIVQMDFENKDFEQNAQKSLQTIEDLKRSLDFENASRNLTALSNAGSKFNLSGIGAAVDQVADKFSYMKYAGLVALANLVDGAVNAGKRIASSLIGPISTGGWNRAMNLEQANFMMKGLLKTDDAVKAVMDDVNESVDGTAYSLDAAAKVAAQFAASGVKAGEGMLPALKAVAGTAAMTNSSFEDIGSIFTTVAGQGKLMTYQMRQLEFRGLNVAATLGEQLGKSEAEIRDMVTKGKISFDDFSDAMNKAFGEHAKEANNTFSGAMANVRSALGRIGAEFATPFIQYAIPALNAFREAVNAVKKSMTPIFNEAAKIMERISNLVVEKLSSAAAYMNAYRGVIIHIFQNLMNSIENIFRFVGQIMKPIKDVFNTMFPPTSITTIRKISQAILDFSKKLQLSETHANAIKYIFAGIFSIFDTAKVFITRLLEALSPLKPAFRLVGLAIEYVAVRFSDLLLQINDFVKNSQEIRNVFNKIRVYATAFSKNLEEGFANLFKGKAIDGSYLKDTINNLIEFVAGGLRKVINMVKGLGPILKDGLSAVPGVFRTLLDTINATIKGTRGTLTEFVQSAGFSSIMDALRSGALTYMLLGLGKAIMKTGGAVGSLVSSTTNLFKIDIFGGIGRGLSNLGNAIQSFAKVELIKSVAKAILEIAFALMILTGLDIAKLEGAVHAISTLFVTMMGAVGIILYLVRIMGEVKTKTETLSKGLLGLFKKTKTITEGVEVVNLAGKLTSISTLLLSLATSMIILASAIRMLANVPFEKITKGLFAIIIMIGALTAAVMVILKSGAFDQAANKIFNGFVKIAAAVFILSYAIKNLGNMEIDDLINGIFGFTIVITELTAAAAILGKVGGKVSIGVIALALSLVIMSKGLQIIGEAVNFKNLIPIVVSLTVVFNLLLKFIQIIGAGDFNNWRLAKTASALNAVAAALLIIGQALSVMGENLNFKNLIPVIATLSLTMKILGDFLIYFTQQQFKPRRLLLTAATLAIMAGALSVMAGALYAISTIPLDKFGSTIGLLLFGMTAMILPLAALTQLADIFGNKAAPEKLILMGAALSIMAGALNVMAVALNLVGMIPLERMKSTIAIFGVGVLGLVVPLIGLMAAMEMFGKAFGTIKITVFAASFVIMASALLVLALALDMISLIPTEKMGSTLAIFSAGVVEMCLALGVLSSLKGAMFNMPFVAKAIMITAGALGIMSAGIVAIASVDVGAVKQATWTLGILITLLGAIFTIASALGPISLLGDVALLTLALVFSTIGSTAMKIAKAMTVLSEALVTFNKVDSDNLTRVFIALGTIAKDTFKNILKWSILYTLLGPIVSTFTKLIGGLGIAILPLATGFGRLANGVAALTTALTTASQSTDDMSNGLKAIAQSIIGAMEALGIGLAIGIRNFLIVLASAAPDIKQALEVIIVNLATLIPEAIVIIFAEVLQTIAFYSESIGRSIAIILTNLLTILAEYSEPIATAASNLIIGLTNAMQDKAPDLSEAGIQLILTLLDDMSNKIVEHQQDFQDAFDKLILSIGYSAEKWGTHLKEIGHDIVSGLVTGITEDTMIGKVTKSAWNMGKGFISKLRDAVDSHSDSKETISIGHDLDGGLVTGVEDMLPEVLGASSLLGDTVLGGLNSSIESGSDTTQNMFLKLENFLVGGVGRFNNILGQAADYTTMKTTTSLASITTEITKSNKASTEYGDTLLDVYERLKDEEEELEQLEKDYEAGLISVNDYEEACEILESRINLLVGDLGTLKENLSVLTGVANTYKAANKQLLLDMQHGKKDVSTFTEEYKKNSEVINAAEKILGKYGDTNKKVAEEEKKASENADGLSTSLGGVGSSAKSAKSELEQMRDSLKSTLQSQMNIFDEFEKKEAMSKDTLLKNMRSQVNGVAEWAANINKLYNMGIEQGLLQKLTELGPEGRDKVAAFASMTADEMAEANQLWIQSLTIQDEIPQMLMGSMQQAGMNIPLGLQQGIDAYKEQYLTSLTGMIDEGNELAINSPAGLDEHSPSRKYYEAAMNIIFGLTNGIRDFLEPVLYPMIRAMVQGMIFHTKETLQAWGEYSLVFYDLGMNIVQGLAQGIMDNMETAVEAAVALAIAVNDAVAAVEEIESPSKVFYGFGEYIDEGFALGIRDKTGVVVNSVEDMATEAINSMKSTIATISSMVNDEFEDPVITPILDLSNVRAGARTLSNAFSTNQALLASASMSGLQNGQYSANGPTFIQNNYSPKSLSRKEIYRDSRNLVSKLKAGTLA